MKTPEKLSSKHPHFENYTASTAYSNEKTHYPFIYSKSPLDYSSPYRQFSNIYPDIYMPNGSNLNSFAKKLEFNGENDKNEDSHEIFPLIREKLEDFFENNQKIENMRENLAYEPDFLINNLFSLISSDKDHINPSDLEFFYEKTLNFPIKINIIEQIYGKSISYVEFNDVFKPKKQVYEKFYEKKSYNFHKNDINFKNIFILKTQALIRKFMIAYIDIEKKNRENWVKIRRITNNYVFDEKFLTEKELNALKAEGIL